MVQRLEQIRLSHPQSSLMISINATDCMALCQTRYNSWCKAISHRDSDNLCHLLGGRVDDPDIALTVDTNWTSLVTYTKG